MINPLFGRILIKDIEENSEFIFRSENFLKIDQSTLVNLLNFTNLKIKEINLLKCCEKWTNHQVLQKSKSPLTTENKIKAFKTIKKYIRFSAISLEELKNFRQIKDLLTPSEMGGLFFYLIDNLNPLPFECKTKRKAFRTYKFNNFYVKLMKPLYILDDYKIINIKFSIGKKLKITSIKTSCPKDNLLKFSNLNGKSYPKPFIETVLADDKWTINFLNPKDFVADRVYELKFDVSGYSVKADCSTSFKLDKKINNEVYSIEIFEGLGLIEQIEFYPSI